MSSAAPDHPPEGLSSARALELLGQVGHNVLPEARRVPAWRALLAQFGHFFALLLWVAAALAFVGGMPALAAAIGAVVVVNGAFAFVQENRAERAAGALRDLLPVLATVVRDGHEQQVTADLIVPGDLVLLAAGDRITADMRCLEAQDALVDTSTLTGESVPIAVAAGDPLLAGCFVVQGCARALVTQTGERTRLGQIARLTQQPRPATPMERDIRHLVRTIALVAAAVGVGFFALMLALGVPAADGFIFGVGVTVALVPEGLLPTVTLSLAIGAQRMAAQNALVRRLESVETLGATTFICTDKTGTLTENRMNVVEVWTPRGSVRIEGRGYASDARLTLSSPQARADVDRAVQAAVLASPPAELAGGQFLGDPMEVAIWVLAERLGLAYERPSADVVFHPFDAARRMSVAEHGTRLACKGAPEAVLEACAARPAGVEAALAGMLRSGLRVLAVAEGPRRAQPPPGDHRAGAEVVSPAVGGSAGPDGSAVLAGPDGSAVLAGPHPAAPAGPHEHAGPSVPHESARSAGPGTSAAPAVPPGSDEHAVPAGAVDPGHGLRLVGLLGYHDPPREGVREAIDRCRHAGVRLAMITGDHPETARSIAAQIGLARPGAPVLEASALPEDPQVLAAMVDHDGVVLARATPEDKLRIAQALQSRGHIVAMTGDGVNDAPALKMADIGIAMGRSGTEVAREAADLVLLDDHFATIVAAVGQGRETFLNVRRFLTYHLTDNVAELAPFVLWALSGGRFPLALGVMQILALDLGTDTLPAAALGAERAAGRVLDHPPVHGRLLDRTVATRAFAVLGPTEASLEIAVFTVALWAAGWHPGGPFPPAADLAAASGGAFLAVVVMQMANAFACRSTRLPAWRMRWTANPYLLVAVAASTGFALACLLVGPLARLLQQGWPPVVALPLIVAAGPLILAVDGAWKRGRARSRHRHRN